ncbi:hypothetical protein niasHS_009760 [Heterodera schachtii]|uniref:Uncharacterized protein n=1 Tax=Heterodera schachtii TaxID=97005 RepID=A0ABD2J196_HETSC
MCYKNVLLFIVTTVAIFETSFGTENNATQPQKKQELTFEKTMEEMIISAKTGKFVRQCSCDEQEPCLKDILTDFQACFETCWEQKNSGKIAPKPEVLKQCFESRLGLVNQFISCINTTAKTCYPTKSGPQIEYVSVQRIVAAGEQRMAAQASGFERAMGPANKPVVQAAEELASCMKDCFLDKDAGQKCFGKSGCQPKLAEDLVGPVIKRCAWRIGWKTEASQMCDCFLDAGVISLKPYCQLFRASAQGPKKTVQSTKPATAPKPKK